MVTTEDNSLDYKPPFPWFGGKRKVAPIVWRVLGDVDNYVEPFFGSGAVLFMRPKNHKGYTETANDYDGYVANFWRAVQAAPEEVAHWADYPVNEIDLTARHIWLVNEGKDRLDRLMGDPDYYDAKVAGWWVWGVCNWIAGGWCTGDGPWTSIDGRLVNRNEIDSDKSGVTRGLPHLGDSGRGINRKSLQLGSRKGVSRGRSTGRGVMRSDQNLIEYMQLLAERLRRVRITCGDWSRVVTAGALDYGDTVGIFLDPPYDADLRSEGLYRVDSVEISVRVRQWCIENGDNPRYRIVLAGYEDEHEMPDTWKVYAWTAGRSYGNSNSETANSENRTKERLWFSPHCLPLDGHVKQMSLFDGSEEEE